MIPACGRERQEDQEFKASLGYTGKFKDSLGYVRPCLQTKLVQMDRFLRSEGVERGWRPGGCSNHSRRGMETRGSVGSWKPGAKGPIRKLLLSWRIPVHQDNGYRDGTWGRETGNKPVESLVTESTEPVGEDSWPVSWEWSVSGAMRKVRQDIQVYWAFVLAGKLGTGGTPRPGIWECGGLRTLDL